LKHFLALFLLTLVTSMTYAQNAQDVSCNSGFRPDGFIDFSALPPAPSSNTTPTTATLPVTGIGGLTVQVTIPPTPQSGSPSYVVQNGIPYLAGTNGAGTVTLTFSQAVSGVGVVGNAPSRGGNFTLQTGESGALPGSFQSTAEDSTTGPSYFSFPLQAVDLGSGFTTATITADAGPDNFGEAFLSNLRVQSTAAAAAYTKMVPREGLQQWLTNAGGSPFAGNVSLWADQSGNGHDATQTVLANQPGRVQGDGNACQGAFSFSGNQYFNFNLPIDGWDQMTIFMVANSLVNPPASSGTSMASAIFWNENANWGNTFVSPYQKGEPFRFGTTQVNNQPVYTRPTTIGQDFTITRAEHDQTTDSLWVNGVLALQQANKLATLSGTTGAAYIGRGLNGTYFNGEISEILVYNRVLSTAEVGSIESYLRSRYGIR
jgi:hypothetical protein